MNRSTSPLHTSPHRWPSPALLAVAITAVASLAAVVPAQSGQQQREPHLPPGCEALRVPTGNVVSLHVFARGMQIYRWDAANGSWVFVAPAALLYADAGGQGVLGVHYEGPTWTSPGGSSVVGRVVAGCTVDPTAVPWLLLGAVTSSGPGPFARTTYVQRVNTVGGRAPARSGTAGEIAYVPYTAEYYFYRAR